MCSVASSVAAGANSGGRGGGVDWGEGAGGTQYYIKSEQGLLDNPYPRSGEVKPRPKQSKGNYPSAQKERRKAGVNSQKTWHKNIWEP